MPYWITVNEVFGTRPKDGGGGYTDFTATTEDGRLTFCNVGWLNQNNQPRPGLKLEFEPYNGQLSFEPSNFAGGKRVSKNSGGSAPPRGAGGGPRPGGPGQAGGYSAAPARPVPTMSQAVAVLRECVAAVQGWGTPEHATTLFLARIRGDVKRDPTPEEAAEAQRQASAAAAAAAAEAQRRADEAARAAAGVPGYAAQPAAGGDNIPF